MQGDQLLSLLHQIPGIGTVTPSGDWHYAIKCLFGHKHEKGYDGNASMTVSFDSGESWATCFSCGYKRPLIKALFEYNRHVGGLGPLIFKAQLIEANGSKELGFNSVRPDPIDQIYTIPWQDMSALPWTPEALELLVNKGVHPKIAKRFGVCVVPAGYHDDWMGRNKDGSVRTTRSPALVLPVLKKDADDALVCVGAQARYLVPKPSPKYWALYKFSATRHLFGEQILPKAIGHKLIIVEGAFDAMHLVGLGFRAIALMGTSLNDAKIALLLQNRPSEVILALDPDSAGQLGAEKAKKLLTKHDLYTRVWTLNKDPKYYTKQEIQDLLQI